jgi:hypothetical protein
LEIGGQRKHNQVAELLTEMERMQNMFNWVRGMAQNIIRDIGDELRCLGDQTDL